MASLCGIELTYGTEEPIPETDVADPDTINTKGDTHDRSATEEYDGGMKPLAQADKEVFPEEAPKVSFLVLHQEPYKSWAGNEHQFNCGEYHFNHHCNIYSRYSISLRVGHSHHGTTESMQCIQVLLLGMPSYLLRYPHYGSYCLKTDQYLSLP